jgi:hypothetical protein
VTKLTSLAAIFVTLISLSACVVAPRPVAPAYVAYPAPVVVGVGECWRCGWHRW